MFAASGNAPGARDPVIVTGAPRTGVRLVAAILDNHPRIASGPDLTLVAALAEQWRRIDSELARNHAEHHALSPEASRAAFRVAALELLAPRLRQSGKERFALQTFTAAVIPEVLASMFPEARFVLMVRNPRDVALSLLQCDWRDVHSGRPLPYTRDLEAAARFCCGFMAGAVQKTRALDAEGRLLTVPYEELCAAPRVTLARLGEFLGEAPPEPLVTPGSATLVTQSADNPHPPLRTGPVDTGSATRWLRARVDAGFGAMAGPLEELCAELGYQAAQPGGSNIG